MVSKDSVIRVDISDDEMGCCIENAMLLSKTMKDRSDLHLRSYMERYINILMGEVAEQAVIKWIRGNGKFAVSAVDKKSGKPDLGHDIVLKNIEQEEILCSVKSSLSVYKSDVEEILKNFTVASKKSEIRNVNIQVYYWLCLNGNNDYRITVPSSNNMAIIGWVTENDIDKFGSYSTEHREVAKIKLEEIRPMASLLKYLS